MDSLAGQRNTSFNIIYIMRTTLYGRGSVWWSDLTLGPRPRFTLLQLVPGPQRSNPGRTDAENLAPCNSQPRWPASNAATSSALDRNISRGSLIWTPAVGEYVAVSLEGILLTAQVQAATNRFGHRMEQHQQIVPIRLFTAGLSTLFRCW